ncbi:histone-like nucleoid-structuring protein Lsr2 [Cumulibacter soli]|uniref:histone-like nucleoid-structuring protein Lsr2 n=1 Tax=Cumulibacter soli TaxID=2546344 RepID=UPI001067668D|nr:Lsr2 family protein [Cumulibacter soli]
MARRTVVVDDIDGTEDAREVTFSLDGETWRIDLSEENRERLRDALSEFIESGVKISGMRGMRARSVRTSGVDLGAVRVWARENGYKVSDRGRVPRHVLDAYEQA